MERETITLEKLQTIIEVMQTHDDETNIDTRVADLIEKKYVERTNDFEGKSYPFHKNFFDIYETAYVIKNLTIQVDNLGGTLDMSRLDKRKGRYNIVFDNLIFEPKTHPVPTTLHIKFPSTANIFFIKNIFKENLNSYVFIEHEEGQSAINITESNFLSDLTFILSSFSSTNSFSSRIKLDNSIFKKLFIWDFIGEDAPEPKQNYHLNLIKNEIESLEISNKNESDCMLVCRRENSISKIKVIGKCPKVASWGLREKIIMEKDKEVIVTNSSTFMAFRKQAIEEGNRFHEVLFQHHITECDEALIKSEPEGFAREEKITMRVGRFFSNHGTSWLRPALILVGVNFVIALLAVIPSGLDLLPSYSYSVYNFGDFLSVFFELFNPLGSLNNIAGDGNIVKKSWWSSFLTVANKLTYAICAYEFIRAARRFTPR